MELIGLLAEFETLERRGGGHGLFESNTPEFAWNV